MTADRLPVTILTGFLGAGKTTLLNRLLKDPAAGRVAIVINEFGAIGLDHDLVEASREDITLLDGGCLCCRLRGDLIRTLRELFFKRAKGAIPAFDRLLIETSGLADPAPILQTLMTDPLLVERYRLDGVVTLVDAELGADTLDRHPEALAQAAIADRILIGKLDRADAAAVAALEARLAALNPAGRITRLGPDVAPAAVVLGNGLWNPEKRALDPLAWLNAGGFEPAHVCGPHCTHGPLPGLAAAAPAARHGEGIASAALVFDHPLPPQHLLGLIDRLIERYGPDLLRVKGLVAVEGMPGPMVLHGVQHVFHPPVRLPAWPSDDRRGRLVAIGRGIDAAGLHAVLASVVEPAEEQIIRL